MENNAAIKLGVVFYGGIAKGAYEVGFMSALSRHRRFSVAAISAASIGALNGYALSSGKLIEAETLWKSVDIKSVTGMYRQLLKRHRIYEFVDKIFSEDDKLENPLYIVCLPASSVQPQYILLNDLSAVDKEKFLKASISVPVVMEPVLINGTKYFD